MKKKPKAGRGSMPVREAGRRGGESVSSKKIKAAKKNGKGSKDGIQGN